MLLRLGLFALTGAGLLSLLLTACAPSLQDFHDRVLEPLAVYKAEELAEQNRLQVRLAFEEAKRRGQWPGERWFELFSWSLDALGLAGYGIPGQGRIVEKVKEFYQRSSDKKRETELRGLLAGIEEQRSANEKAIFHELINQTSEEPALYGRIYSVCEEGTARRYRGTGNGFRRLADRPC
jgi:hypothetical protein